MSSSEQYSMVQECTDRYEAKRSNTGDLEISIRVPQRFADLWLVKLRARANCVTNTEGRG